MAGHQHKPQLQVPGMSSPRLPSPPITSAPLKTCPHLGQSYPTPQPGLPGGPSAVASRATHHCAAAMSPERNSSFRLNYHTLAAPNAFPREQHWYFRKMWQILGLLSYRTMLQSKSPLPTKIRHPECPLCPVVPELDTGVIIPNQILNCYKQIQITCHP